MKLKKSSWHATFFKWSYGHYDSNGCNYLKYLILAIISLPLSFVGYLIPYWRENSEYNLGHYVVVGLYMYFLIIVSYVSGLSLQNIFQLENIILITITGAITISLIIIVLFLICYGFYLLLNALPNIIKNINNIKKKKYCFKINWEE